jgi:hypothetical protein
MTASTAIESAAGKKTYSGSENRRRNVVRTMRFDDAEQAAIDEAAAAAGISFSELVRRSVLRDIGFAEAV